MQSLDPTLASLLSQSDDAVSKNYYDQALQFLQKALEYAQNVNDKQGEAVVTHKQADLCVEKQDLSEAARLYIRARYLFSQLPGNEYKVALLYGIVGDTFRKQEQLEKAGACYREALRFFEVEDHRGLDKALTEQKLARVLAKQQRKDEARIYYERALQFFTHKKDVLRVARLLISLGNLCTHQDELPRALEYYVQADMQLDEMPNKEDVEYTNTKAALLHNIGTMYFHKQDYSNAFDYLEKARTLHRQVRLLNNSLYMQEVKTLFTLGDICERREEWDDAIGYYKEAWVKIQADKSTISEEAKREFEGLARLHLGRCRRKQGRFDDALRYLVEAQTIFKRIKSYQYAYAEEQIEKVRREMNNNEYFLSLLKNAEHELSKLRDKNR